MRNTGSPAVVATLTGRTQPGRNGGTLKVGGDHHRPGRPPTIWLARLQALATRDVVLAHLEAALLEGPSRPEFWLALRYVFDRGCGPVRRAHESSGPDKEAVTVRVLTGRLLEQWCP